VSLKTPATFLLASHDPKILKNIEPVLLACGAQVEVVLSLEAAMGFLSGCERPAFALIDTSLPALDPRMSLDRLLAAARAEECIDPLSIVLISDTVTQSSIDRLADGIIDDLILRAAEIPYWRVRIEMALRHRHKVHELETFREAAALNEQMDHLTRIYNRETILGMLFRETDRVQRMNGALSLVLLDLDDFGHWNSQLGNDVCDDLLCQVAGRVARLQRSYDLLGRPGKDEFLLVLPGCSVGNAFALAERIRSDVFCVPFQAGDASVRLSACFGIAASKGRSPVVVLREAEQALQWAREAGHESIQCFGDYPEPSHAPVTFLTSSSGDGLVAW
jgi:diguanylate cyclase (GGDEF)-like protein